MGAVTGRTLTLANQSKAKAKAESETEIETEGASGEIESKATNACSAIATRSLKG